MDSSIVFRCTETSKQRQQGHFCRFHIIRQFIIETCIINTLRPEQDDDILPRCFHVHFPQSKSFLIDSDDTGISLQVHVVAWYRTGDRPLSEPMATPFNGARMRICLIFTSKCYNSPVSQLFLAVSSPEERLSAHKPEQPTSGCIAIFLKYCCWIKQIQIYEIIGSWYWYAEMPRCGRVGHVL